MRSRNSPIRDTVFFSAPTDLRFERLRRTVRRAVQDAGMRLIEPTPMAGESLREYVPRSIEEAEVFIAYYPPGASDPNVDFEAGISVALGKKILVLAHRQREPVNAPLASARVVHVPENERLDQFGGVLAQNLVRLRHEPINELAIDPEHHPYTAVAESFGEVIESAEDHAVIQIASGRRALLLGDDVTWSRPRIPVNALLRVGDRISGGVYSTKDQGLRFSLTALSEDPWPRIQREFPIGEPFLGEILSTIPKVGSFVTVDRGVVGLIPASRSPKHTTLQVGAQVVAKPIRIDPVERRMELRFIRMFDSESPDSNPVAALHAGDRLHGEVVHVHPKRHYVLVELPSKVVAILHREHMGRDLLARFDHDLLIGSSIDVAVLRVDPVRGRAALRDAALTHDGSPSSGSTIDETTARARLESELLRLFETTQLGLALVHYRPEPIEGDFDPFGAWESLERWAILFREEIAEVRRTRNEVANGRRVPLPILLDAVLDAARVNHPLEALALSALKTELMPIESEPPNQ